MAVQYDVIIVGGGPAGIFAALELSQTTSLRILLVEKGKDTGQRRCPVRDSGGHLCINCSPCDIVSGLGGAGAFSDGKLTLSTDVGGHLKDYLGANDAGAVLDYVDERYRQFGAADRLYGVGEEVNQLRRRAHRHGLGLIPMPLRHLGTERCFAVLKAMRDHLEKRIDIQLETTAARLIVHRGQVSGVETVNGDRFYCSYLILAPGREGADWLLTEAKRVRLSTHINPIDVGIRVEVPASVMDELTNVFYEVKLEFQSRSFNDRIRTFCMCPHGEVIMESTGGTDPVVTVNGHSYAEQRSENTNFALLMSTTFTEPFHEPIAYGKYLARLANILSGGVLVQRLGDLIAGRRSTPQRIDQGQLRPSLESATPGDLSFVLPYRHLTGIMEMLEAMDQLAPGVASEHTLLYGVEVKFYSCRLQLSPHLETEVGNMFAVGDGAGVSRGLIQASASGVVAAREVIYREINRAKADG